MDSDIVMLRDIAFQWDRQSSPYWPAAQQRQFPAYQPQSEKRCDYAIVGGGLIGLFAAYYLSNAGHSVVVLDSGAIGGEASGHSGGLLLDKCEAGHILQRQNTELAVQVYRDSYRGVTTLSEVAIDEGFDAGFRHVGYITGFRNDEERGDYLRQLEFLKQHLPEYYRHAGSADMLSPTQTGAPKFFTAGGIHSHRGGTFNPQQVVTNMVRLMKDEVRFFEASRVTALEPAYGGVRLHVNQTSLEADHVLLAGGASYELMKEWVEDLPEPQPIAAAMVATGALPEKLYNRMVSERGADVPVMAVGSCASSYWRFANGRLLFGSGAGLGTQKAAIWDQIEKDLFRVFPALRTRVEIESCWGRVLYQNANHLPTCLALTKDWEPHGEWPKDLSGAPVVFLGCLGGQGNNFGPYLARQAARAMMGGDAATKDLRAYFDMRPTRTFTLHAAQQQARRDRYPKQL